MSLAVHEEAPQEDRMAYALNSLANPARLRLLRHLQTPRVLKEIQVTATRASADSTERPMSRQAVKAHLDKLVEAGVVVTREVERDYGTTVEYIVNHQNLFLLSEEFRSIAHLRPTISYQQLTVEWKEKTGKRSLQGPCLVLVKGIDEGRIHPLATPDQKPRQWIIGRAKTSDIPLDYDPAASSRNTLIVHEDGKFYVEDLKESRNGTGLNFSTLPPGERSVLDHGDLIQVGRSILMFHG